jgi:hypothetical protein
MIEQKPRGIRLASTLCLLALTLFLIPSRAQELPHHGDIDPPFIDNFEIPKTLPGDLRLPDEDLPVSDSQAREFGNAMVADQARIYDDILKLEVALKDRIDQLIPELGRTRASEIKSALTLPEKSGERVWKLRKLHAKTFMSIPEWDSDSGHRMIGEALFLERVNKGGNWIDDFRVLIPGVGFAEPKLVGGKLYPRMVDEATGSSHFFLESELEIESPEWRRYVARGAGVGLSRTRKTTGFLDDSQA